MYIVYVIYIYIYIMFIVKTRHTHLRAIIRKNNKNAIHSNIQR